MIEIISLYLTYPEWLNSSSMYLQTIHEKKLLDSYIYRGEYESLYSIVK